jgi:predicted nucleotidyltransferase
VKLARCGGTLAPVIPAETLRTLSRQYADLLVQALGDRLVSVVLFGSVARGDASPDSDIDLLIVARDLPRGHFARKRLLARADSAFEPLLADARAGGVSARLARIVRTPEEARRRIPLYLDLTEDAVLLHDPHGFFRGVIDEMRDSLRRLGSRRVRSGDSWYWDLKPDFKPGEKFEL